MSPDGESPGGPDAGAGVRVVLQNGEYWLRNNGDLAMLEVTVARIRERWPLATISVITSAPSLLVAYLPGVHPLSDGRLPGLAAPFWRVAAKLGPAVVGPASARWLELRQRLSEYLAARRPAPEEAPEQPASGEAPAEPALLPVVADAVRSASLVLAIGGGYVTDVDPAQALRTFDVLAAARERGIPAAMVGQGLGPLVDPALVARAAQVLPDVDLIALREGRAGPALLAELGVPAERVVVTGDDAIELAHGVRTARPGTDLGICLRVADYSPVGVAATAAVRASVHALADELSAGLVPLIISEYRSEDRRSTLPLVEGAPRVVPPLGPFVSARDVARRVSRCRVVVTGAYHLAVFALSQGIPVVALTSSEYYDDKFLGLAAMFEGGIELVHLDDPALQETLTKAVRTSWEAAPALRDQLLARAAAQITASRTALEQVFRLIRRE
ncbi:polysaccharide pyruvyl transferase family protein [Pseudonocardia sp. CA-107938]|uniref:polysaccharide pyruvyl transferase family protein n=1 Tax=Pseudonocardia sp. CA-107938 TaxID=3240021 RepID=UPI003D8DF350